MRICDLCETKTSAVERDIPFEEFKIDMCDKHYKEFVDAVKLATSLFRTHRTISDREWSDARPRLRASGLDVVNDDKPKETRKHDS